MSQKTYDFVVVGSGTGGSILARDLSLAGKSVLVIEGGKRETHVGTFKDACRYYDSNHVTHIPKKAVEGTIIWRSFMVGGSSAVSCGNGVRCLEAELGDFGIYLEDEFKEAEEMTHTMPIDEKLLSEGSLYIREAASELGYHFELMPKMMDASKCHQDHSCNLGCRYHARWSGEEAIDEATQIGAEILTETWVDHVLIEHGKAVGVVIRSASGMSTLYGNCIILAAGGVGTPLILNHSGLDQAGSNLFLDLFVNVYGKTKGLNLAHEPQMSLVDLEFHEEEGFLLSPYVSLPPQVRLIETGVMGTLMSPTHMIGLMVKTRDEGAGQVFPDGKISKPITRKDRKQLERGQSVAKEILIKAGADPKSILVSAVEGAHPGGTAAIGGVVNENLQTPVERLFVCDASVLPIAPGLPPILTIIALAKWLTKRLV